MSNHTVNLIQAHAKKEHSVSQNFEGVVPLSCPGVPQSYRAGGTHILSGRYPYVSEGTIGPA